MTTDLLVLAALWCFAVFCFGFGWIMGAASAMGKHADEIVKRTRLTERDLWHR